MPVLMGTESARPFLPSRDFTASKRFYERLGFKKVLDGDVVIFEAGTSRFIVQNYFEQHWADNFMMQLMVDDLDAWWRHIEELDLPATFGVKQPRPPTMQTWGLRVAFVFDPAGVLWHVAERRKGNAADA
jgi:catechol 2,3-dioxygenase-like lactoylglutathione lyase family enzyme